MTVILPIWLAIIIGIPLVLSALIGMVIIIVPCICDFVDWVYERKHARTWLMERIEEQDKDI